MYYLQLRKRLENFTEKENKMDKIVQEEGKKRRLPLWMLGVSTADQVERYRNGKVNGVSNMEKEEVAPQCRPTKSRGGRKTAPCDSEISPTCEDAFEEQSKLVVKRDIVKRKRKTGSKDVPNNSNDAEETVSKKSKHCRQGRAAQESVGWGRGKIDGKRFESSKGKDIETALSNEDDGRAIQIPVCQRRGKAQSNKFESNKDIEAVSPNEDDGDLTMDDLMSIAEEFVKDNKSTGQQNKTDADKPCAATSFSRNDPGGSLTAPEFDRRSQEHKETASGRDPAEITTSEGTWITTSEGTLGNPSSTGDPAQDMLDLFLGPLLKKPLKEQKKAEIITDDMITAHEFTKENQKVVIGDAAVPLTKKKTSLKDKVAMFLD